MSSPWFSTIVTLPLVLVSLSRGSADELPGSERPLTAGEIAALIRKLESRKFREREEASRALKAAGDDALNALRQASAQSNDPRWPVQLGAQALDRRGPEQRCARRSPRPM